MHDLGVVVDLEAVGDTHVEVGRDRALARRAVGAVAREADENAARAARERVGVRIGRLVRDVEPVLARLGDQEPRGVVVVRVPVAARRLCRGEGVAVHVDHGVAQARAARGRDGRAGEAKVLRRCLGELGRA